jgi:HAE1 family hydrophobic/amphiphilic exporter-1
LVRHFEERLAVMPEVEKFEANVYGQYGFIQVTFPDSLELTAVPVAIKEQMVAYSLGYSGAQVRVYGFGPSFYGGGSSPPNYSITVLGYNYERVRDIAEDLGGRLTRLSRIRDVNTNSSGSWFERDRATEFMVTVDRDALARYDMSVNEFIWRFNSLVSGEARQDQLKIGGEEVRYEVKVEGYRDIDVQALNERIITGAAGLGIRVGDVVHIEPKEILARIRREDQQYQRLVTYEFRGPRKLGDMVHEAVIDATVLPPGYTVKKADRWRWDDEERSQIYMVLAISVILIFMVTSALFESMRQPLCVLLTVPMALIGVFLIFFYTNASFTREAYIGVIMMGGIVVNNAILLVDHINRVRRETSHDLVEAILQGTLERVRPILMTATTTVLGLLPLVVMSTGGTEGRIWNALGYALIGGLLSSTVFVLTTTPALYYLFERGRAERAAAGKTAPAPTLGLEPELIGD